jgi:hypothetical protein
MSEAKRPFNLDIYLRRSSMYRSNIVSKECTIPLMRHFYSFFADMFLPVLSLLFLVTCAACSAFAQGRVPDTTVYMLQNEQLQNKYTACVQVGVAARKGYVPGISMSARFENAVSSTIEVNGRAVQTMPNSSETSHNENYIKDGETFRITLSVASPVHVVWFYVGGDKEMGIIEVRKISCPPATTKK